MCAGCQDNIFIFVFLFQGDCTAVVYIPIRHFFCLEAEFSCDATLISTCLAENISKFNTSFICKKKVHLKVLESSCSPSTEEERVQADAVSIELAVLNGLCNVQNRNNALVQYLGFHEFKLQNSFTVFTVIVTTFINGISFRIWNKLQRNLASTSFTRRVRLMRQLADTLDFVHRKQYSHNDLSPNNFMVVDNSAGESIVLIDFGSARPPGKVLCSVLFTKVIIN